ncbi:MAG: SURF1 family protein [Wenzhouxiangella sp.]
MTNSRHPFSWRSLVPHIAALVAIALCLRLALWQVDRAGEKSELMTLWETSEPVSLLELGPGIPGFSPASGTGMFDNQRTILLDNQVRNNHPGVHVFSPFVPEGGGKVLLVNRGWQPWLRRSGEWPAFETPTEMVEIAGRLSEPPRVGLQLGEEPPIDTEQWPSLMTYFDMDRLREAFGDQLHDQVLLLDPDHPAHLSGDAWAPINMGPEKHMGYAFQWVSIGSAILIIWLVLSIRKMRRR